MQYADAYAAFVGDPAEHEAHLQSLADTLAQKLPEADFILPEGGYFMWAQLPDGADAEALQKAAADKGVQIVKGSDFIEDGGGSAFRLAYSAEPPERIEEGITILGDVYAEL